MLASTTTRLTLLFLALHVATGASAADSFWPGWRGPARDGQVAPSPRWPGSLDEDTLTLRWSVKLGPSYSGPIVDERAVYVTETEDAREEVTRAYSRADGKKLWETRWEGAMRVPFFAASNGSWIRATPAVDDERLYVAGMRDVLVALDVKDGREVWRVDFVERFQSALPSFGFVSSPLLTGKHVVVQAGASVVQLDKATGATVWRSLKDQGGMNGSAFSSPVRARIAGRDQLVVQSRESLAGLDEKTGAVLWQRKIEAFRGMNILTPVVLEDRVFTSSYGGGTVCLEIGKSDEGFSVSESWNEKTQAYMCSPVIVDGRAYLHLRNRRFAAFDLAAGERLWTSTERFGQYMSLVAQDDRILGLDERGILFLLRANPEKLEILAERKVSESATWAHLAVAGDELFVRSIDGLGAWTWRGVEAADETPRESTSPTP